MNDKWLVIPVVPLVPPLVLLTCGVIIVPTLCVIVVVLSLVDIGYPQHSIMVQGETH